ncbi:MAG: DNA cytosine methyltransferase [Leucobacter sp.]
MFSSAGLGCYGFSSTGFQCVATAELLPRRLAVQTANGLGWRESSYVLGDLSTAETKQRVFKEVSDWKDGGGGEITVLIATPPCQGISVANHKKRDNEIVRNSLVLESLEMIATIAPKYFILENVRGFLGAACKAENGPVRTIGEAIDVELGAHYNITHRTANLKEHGSPSSRTRTIVIGVRSDIHGVSPAELLPDHVEAPSLRELVNDLPSLTEMGEYAESDYLHGFRPYEERMRPWIRATPEGASAFDNDEPQLRPHRIINGRYVANQAKNGDKYARASWDKVAPCVHTRNDILASQATVHPEDDRVFSIRELSRMMGVPSDFRWSHTQPALERATSNEVKHFYAENEVNIRQCLGEGVPTPVFSAMAEKIRAHQQFVRPGPKSVAGDPPFIAPRLSEFEAANPRKKELSAFYTRQDIAFRLISDLRRALGPRKSLRVLEPSVGAGALLPELLRQFSDIQLELDLVDLDAAALAEAEALVHSLAPTVTVRSWCADFLTLENLEPYDAIVGNPPFGRLRGTTSDLSDLFTQKALELSGAVAFVLPKAVLGAPKYAQLRAELSGFGVVSIDDYGESAFETVGIETIGLTASRSAANTIEVASISRSIRRTVATHSIIDDKLPTWLLYRDETFDGLLKQYRLGNFSVVRDRELTSKDISHTGPHAVIRGRDIPRERGLDIEVKHFLVNGRRLPRAVSQYAGRDDALVVPNLSYYPRARSLPPGALVDGSAAVLLPKSEIDLDQTIDLISSPEFTDFYRVARNFSTRSLNVDASSVYYWPSVPLQEMQGASE